MNIENALDWNRILGTVIPIYFVIFLGYASVRWWKILTPEQCNGINKYVAEIAFPFLVLEMLMTTNLYNTNFLVIAADSVQKIFILVILFLLKFVIKGFTFEWLVTLFMISAFTNNVAIGIPLIGSIYGEGLTPLLIQILVFQSIIWFNLALFMYEYISAKQQVIDNKVENEIPLSAEISSIDPNNIGLVYPEKIVAHESIDVDVKIDHSEPSLQQQTTPTSISSSATKKVNQGGGIIKLILINFVKNTVMYVTIIGSVWSLISFRFNFKRPLIIQGMVEFISQTAIGTTVFSLGVCIALQPKLDLKLYQTLATMGARFILGPATMIAASLVVGLKGDTFQVAVIQATFPALILSFVIAKHHNVYPEAVSNLIIISILLYLPVTIFYYLIITQFGHHSSKSHL